MFTLLTVTANPCTPVYNEVAISNHIYSITYQGECIFAYYNVTLPCRMLKDPSVLMHFGNLYLPLVLEKNTQKVSNSLKQWGKLIHAYFLSFHFLQNPSRWSRFQWFQLHHVFVILFLSHLKMIKSNWSYRIWQRPDTRIVTPLRTICSMHANCA